MLRPIRLALLCLAICVLVGTLAERASAGTIIKLNLGNVSPDIAYDGTTLSTAPDGNGDTPGDQDTAVEFLDFLDSEVADIVGADASFSLDGVLSDGSAVLFGGTLVLQNFTGGTFSLYGSDDSLLLSGELADSALSGTVGFTSGALFTTSFGSVTAGSLLPFIGTDSLVLSMNFTSVDSDGSPGFAVTPGADIDPPFIIAAELHEFTADASINIEAAQVPEPTTAVVLLIGCAAGLAGVRRKKRM